MVINRAGADGMARSYPRSGAPADNLDDDLPPQDIPDAPPAQAMRPRAAEKNIFEKLFGG